MKLNKLKNNPDNPRVLRDEKFRNLVESIRNFPDMLNPRPIVVDENYMILGGNMRWRALQEVYGKAGEIPDEWVHVVTGWTDEQKREFVIRDNAHSGEWDWNELANGWDSTQLATWDVPCWENPDDAAKKKQETDDDFYKKLEGGVDTEEYNEFLEKFEAKHTTDDCYTPRAIYDEVVKFVGERFNIGERPIVRPFFPGGDYEHHDYPKDCVVIDNPPFSIYSKIVRFYLEHGIDFFLFGPAMTLAVKGADVCYYVVGASVIYDNGANVSTSFVTNMDKENRVVTIAGFKDRIEDLNEKNAKETKGKLYDDHITTCALVRKIASHHTDFEIKKHECAYINDDHIEGKNLIFGGGFILSENATENMRKAMAHAESMKEQERREQERREQERREQERRAAEPVNLSAKGWAVVKKLSEQTTEKTTK